MPRRSTRVLAGLLVAGWFTSWVPQLIPLDWVDLAPVAWERPTWQETGAVVADAVTPLEQSEVPGVHPIRAVNDEVSLRAILLPGSQRSARPLDEMIQADLWRIIDEHAGDAETEFTPGPSVAGGATRGCIKGSTTLGAEELRDDHRLAPATATGVAVNCDIIFATGDLIGVRTRVTTPDDDRSEVHVMNVFTGTREATTSFWLADDEGDVAPEVMTELWPLVVDTLRRDARSISTGEVHSEVDDELMRRILADTVFTPEGDVQLHVPPGFSAPELRMGEPLETFTPVTLTFDRVEPLLTETATSVRAVVLSGEPFFIEPMWAGHVDIDCKLIACVAITFEAGPTDITPGVLDVLYGRGVPATFFVRGELAEAYPAALWRAFAEGHSVQNGTWSGVDLVAEKDPLEVQTEITQTRNLITDTIEEVPTMLRPGEGSADKRLLDLSRMAIVNWDVDGRDGDVGRIITEAAPGSIIRLSDGDERSLAMLGALIDALEEQGFEIATLKQLFGGVVPPPGLYEHAR